VNFIVESKQQDFDCLAEIETTGFRLSCRNRNYKFLYVISKMRVVDLDRPSNEIKIIAWNPNGIRALVNNNLPEIKRMLNMYDPDIVVWNETKGNENVQDATQRLMDEKLPGYRWYWNNSSQRAGTHGVAIMLKPSVNVLSVDYGLHDWQKEPEGRVITIELNEIYIVGVYVVNVGMNEVKRTDYKLEWMARLVLHCEKLKVLNPHKKIIITGDMNVAPCDIDIHNPKTNKNSAGFTAEEKECFQWFLHQGWVDLFRQKYPLKVAYTYYHTRTNARARGAGWRIDMALLDKTSFDKLEHGCDDFEFETLEEFYGSDHVPIYLKLKL
jgi:exodeoxyribonuclease III